MSQLEPVKNLVALFAILGIVHTGSTWWKNKNEYFSGGFGWEFPTTDSPFFVNLYPPQREIDFKLFDFIQRLRFQTIPRSPRALLTHSSFGEISVGPTRHPVIIIPDIGASKILGTWNRQNSMTVKNVDSSKTFEKTTPDKWTCRTYQPDWATLWFPQNQLDHDEVSKYCWYDNVRVNYDSEKQTLSNQDGVQSTVPHFGKMDFDPPTYMKTLKEGLQAQGFEEESSMFGAPYDFRLIADPNTLKDYFSNLHNLIEGARQVNQGKPSTILAHGFGAVLANLFLQMQTPEWKTQNITSLVSVAGTFGGNPKALRVFLSGENMKDNKERIVFRSAIRNFSSLLASLPSPTVYGNLPLVTYQGKTYTSHDIPKMMNLTGANDSAKIYETFIKPFQEASLNPPGVPVYVLAGNKLPTESTYLYENSLLDTPKSALPYYSASLPYDNYENFPQENQGDGLTPDFALRLPLLWTNTQEQPIYFKFYERAEHLKILEMNESVQDILDIVS